MWQILTGIAYVHAQDVIHRDVKPQNLLIARTLPSLKTSSESKASSSSSDSKDVKNLDPKTAINSSSSVTVGAKSSPSSAQILAVGGGWETATLKWADFGLSRTMNIPLKSLTDDVVTLWYRPPEVLLGSQQYDNKIDLWSVGCVFAELITGEALFTGQEKEDQLKAIFSTVGMPTVENWPGWRSIGESSQKKTYTGNYNRKRTLQDVVKPLSKSGMDLLLVRESGFIISNGINRFCFFYTL
jgi:serine/threonine protein kinase